MIDRWVDADDVEIGDVLMFLGAAHQIDRIDRTNGFGDRIADCVDGFSMTLSGAVLVRRAT